MAALLLTALLVPPAAGQDGEPLEPADALDELTDGERQAEDFVAAIFTEEITVSRRSVTARIVDPSGELVTDLAPEEIVARIGGVEVPVTGVDFRAYGRSRAPESPTRLAEAENRRPLDVPSLEWTEPEPAPRQIVILMQIGGHDVATLESSYVRGHQQSLPGLREFLAGLDPGDLVALLSYDVRLKLWSDFTRDHRYIESLLFETLGFAEPPRHKPPRAEPGRGPSLARTIPRHRLEDATSPGEAMAVLAAAFEQIDGPKDVLYVGWDVTGYSGFLSGLQRSRTTVSVLDVTQADRHLLAAPLETMAAATGGTYESVFRFPKRGTRRIARTLAGEHVITLDLEAAKRESGRLELSVPGRDVTVHMRAYSF